MNWMINILISLDSHFRCSIPCSFFVVVLFQCFVLPVRFVEYSHRCSAENLNNLWNWLVLNVHIQHTYSYTQYGFSRHTNQKKAKWKIENNFSNEIHHNTQTERIVGRWYGIEHPWQSTRIQQIKPKRQQINISIYGIKKTFVFNTPTCMLLESDVQNRIDMWQLDGITKRKTHRKLKRTSWKKLHLKIFEEKKCRRKFSTNVIYAKTMAVKRKTSSFSILTQRQVIIWWNSRDVTKECFICYE